MMSRIFNMPADFSKGNFMKGPPFVIQKIGSK
jgi:hypothetical protein